ncbi:MFS transporter [Kaistia dalseonensis]|uniref:MFS family permease n=1 Tax=Kaistia dalseonensis TaxID=410840 RepID=A0ABU0HAZ8_9HYPH|nr:MFS transporter [Kaistia dalseonensis]MCX5496867.1 MFS transporter [Kaistia dalseonensis]MDQ0439493.1 MFS family permease [Kaistia dalseonensis]
MAIPTTSANRQARFFVALAILVALLNSTAASPLYTAYRQMWSLNAFTISAIFAIYALGTLTALLVLGRLSDRLPDRRILIGVSLLIVMAGAILFATAGNLHALLIGRLFAGVGTGGLTGAANAALIELDPKADTRRNAVIATAAFTGGCALGPLLSAVALHFDAWPLELPFFVIAALAVITLVGLLTASWRVAPRVTTAPTSAEIAAEMPERGRLTAFAVAAGGLIIAWSVGSTFAALGPTFIHELLDIGSMAAAGVIIALFQLVAGISQIACQNFRSDRALIAGTIVIATATMLCATAIWIGAPALFIAGTVLNGVGYGAAFVGAAGITNRIAPPRRRSTWISAFYMTGYLANALPVLVLGKLGDTLGLFGAFLCLTGFAVFATAVVSFAARIVLSPMRRATA